jgi:hypothetical protein
LRQIMVLRNIAWQIMLLLTGCGSLLMDAAGAAAANANA